jgi:hypothetical protein
MTALVVWVGIGALLGLNLVVLLVLSLCRASALADERMEHERAHHAH